MANLTAAFQSLPESIRQWLSDEHVAAIIDDINQRLNLTEENGREEIIPHLILRLCVQDLDPRQFINELSHWLDIGFESAKILTKELEEKILQPIAEPLKTSVGVDLRMLSFAVPEPRSAPPPTPPPEFPVSATVTAAIPAALSTEPLAAAPPVSQNPAPEKPAAEPPPAESPRPLHQPSTSDVGHLKTVWQSLTLKPITGLDHDAEPAAPAPPLILHEEKNPVLFDPNANPSGQTPQSSFRYKVPIELTPDKPPEPVRATIEFPLLPAEAPQSVAKAGLPADPSANTVAAKAAIRIIHYSAFTTRLIPSQEPPPVKPTRFISVPKSKWFI